jgi:hypothetical protein
MFDGRPPIDPIWLFLPLILAVVLTIVWNHRNLSGEGEPPPWRYRDRTPSRVPVARQAPSRPSERPTSDSGRGRRISLRTLMRAELLIAGGAIGIIALPSLVTGSLFQSTESGPSMWFEPFVGPAGLLAALAGLGWMIWIYRRSFEGKPPAWRYRDRP